MNDDSDDARASIPDPLIDEIRAIRQQLSHRFDNDPRRLGEYARQVGEAFRAERSSAATPSEQPSSTTR